MDEDVGEFMVECKDSDRGVCFLLFGCNSFTFFSVYALFSNKLITVFLPIVFF